ncbi:MAG TPA: flavin reductase family protein [bacterium]|nr:flavin reductase family protein [bacterium]HQG44143.1 flavin reductase family protein [bacterium]HQI49335.1 flavin reductase family protein [bacterium]HQJ64149.1 flavin reductase family protein [bacterium]
MLKQITPGDLVVSPFDLLDKSWALVVAGTDQPNPMTVSWGGFGTLWNQPMVTIYIRPTRYTFDLLNSHPEFTLNFMPAKYHSALNYCGSHSGRNENKWEKAGLQPLESTAVAVPRVAGVALSFECRIMAWQDFQPEHFLQSGIEGNYPRKDYHRIFWGEPLAIWLDERWEHSSGTGLK